MLASATPCFFAASTTAVAHLWNFFDVLLVAADAGDHQQMRVLRGGDGRGSQDSGEQNEQMPDGVERHRAIALRFAEI